mmetsp:Transcript_144397/g.462659  ORF Transcript_144397/g.462659 Transcript_144397/m.462659 type:complete len:221 (+) Transcript_144397:286-948(+)
MAPTRRNADLWTKSATAPAAAAAVAKAAVAGQSRRGSRPLGDLPGRYLRRLLLRHSPARPHRNRPRLRLCLRRLRLPLRRLGLHCRRRRPRLQRRPFRGLPPLCPPGQDRTAASAPRSMPGARPARRLRAGPSDLCRQMWRAGRKEPRATGPRASPQSLRGPQAAAPPPRPRGWRGPPRPSTAGPRSRRRSPAPAPPNPRRRRQGAQPPKAPANPRGRRR